MNTLSSLAFGNLENKTTILPILLTSEAEGSKKIVKSERAEETRYFSRTFNTYENNIPLCQVTFKQEIIGMNGKVTLELTNLTSAVYELKAFSLILVPSSGIGQVELFSNIAHSLAPHQTQVIDVFDYRPRIDLSTIEISIARDTQS